MNKINVYTDGSARGNPGPGGYGIVLEYKGHIKEISEGFKLTTNNRMELLAVIVGLESIKQTDCFYIKKKIMECNWISRSPTTD